MSTGRSTTAVVLGVAAHQVRVEAHVAAGCRSGTWSACRTRPSASRATAFGRPPPVPGWRGRRAHHRRAEPRLVAQARLGIDLGIAVAVLSAANPPPQPGRLADWMFVGELGLDGTVRPVGTVLPAAIAARASGLARFVVPWGNRREASLVSGLDVLPVVSLRHLWAVLSGDEQSIAAEEALGRDDGGLRPTRCRAARWSRTWPMRGQDEARQALVVAAAGGHHLCLSGPAGWARPSSPAASLAAAGPDRRGVPWRPRRSGRSRRQRHPPDWSGGPRVQAASLGLGRGPGRGRVGGPTPDRPGDPRPRWGVVPGRGSGVLRRRPGCAASGHGGAHRPLARAGFQVELPARFQLVLATNPCPCGRALDTAGRPCGCSSAQRRRYLARLNGPLLDRVDVRLTLRRPPRRSWPA